MKPVKEGKVREIYDNGDSLIMVATDRISCFDVILKNTVTKKGTVLTQMSKFWFDMTADILPNHMISTDVKDMPEFFRQPAFDGNSMMCKKLRMLPLECIVRGYITGSGWASYQKDGTVCGIRLPEGLNQSVLLRELGAVDQQAEQQQNQGGYCPARCQPAPQRVGKFPPFGYRLRGAQTLQRRRGVRQISHFRSFPSGGPPECSYCVQHPDGIGYHISGGLRSTIFHAAAFFAPLSGGAAVCPAAPPDRAPTVFRQPFTAPSGLKRGSGAR